MVVLLWILIVLSALAVGAGILGDTSVVLSILQRGCHIRVRLAVLVLLLALVVEVLVVAKVLN